MTLTADTWLRAPFPWYGGKRRVASRVWEYLGTNAGRYVEPFAGSLGVLLGRPHVRGLEVVNDIDGYIVNVWRALKHAPDETISWADDLRSEIDLTARRLWLVNEGAKRLREGLETDPEWYDAKIAGWWLYGIALWIGQGFARANRGSDGQGIRRQLPHLGDDGQGIHRQLPHLGDDGQGVISPGIYSLARALQRRLRHVVICNGDWKRVVTPTALRAKSGHTAIYLDPPYEGFEDAYRSKSVWEEVVDWCEAHTDSEYRIVLSGYAGSRSPKGWREEAYTAKGTSSKNRTAERLWVSPACGGPLPLFSEMPEGELRP